MVPRRFCWSSAALSDVGLVRRINEDAFLDARERGLWAVADGMGGHDFGELASGMLIQALDCQPPCTPLAACTMAVRGRLQRVNADLRRLAETRGVPLMGTTVVVLLAQAAQCIVLWAGDSRAYLMRRGLLQQLTRDHRQPDAPAPGSHGSPVPSDFVARSASVASATVTSVDSFNSIAPTATVAPIAPIVSVAKGTKGASVGPLSPIASAAQASSMARAAPAGSARSARAGGGHDPIEPITKNPTHGNNPASCHGSARDAPGSGTNTITRAVGAAATLTLDEARLSAEDGDIFLLCSDGLTNFVTDVEIARVLLHGSCRNASQALVELALQRGGGDNVTVVVVLVTDLYSNERTVFNPEP